MVGVGGFWLFWPRTTLPADLLRAIPADAYGVARIRVDRVIASEAYRRLVVAQGQARGIERVREACGFNPLERLSSMMVFARPAPARGIPRFAFVARGTLDHEALMACVTKLGGGGGAAGLAREDVEGVPTVVSKRGSSRAAFFGHDGVIAGDAESVRAAIHTALGKAPSFAEDPQASSLHHELDHADIALTARLGDDLKPLVEKLVAVAGPDLEVLREVRAVSLNLTARDERIVGGAVLIAGDPARAAGLVGLAQQSIARLLAIPGMGLTPAAGVLRSVQTEARGERATFAGSVRIGTVEGLLELAPALQSLQRDAKPSAGGSGADAGMAVDKPEDVRREARGRREQRPRIVEDDP